MKFTVFKKTVSLIISLLLIFTFCGCSNTKTYNSAELSKEILNKTAFSELKELSGSSLSSYFVFKDGDIKRFNVRVSATGESADTVACFEVVDENQRSTVISGISKYLNKLSTSFKATMESEYLKVQNRVLVEIEDIVILVICNDYGAAKQYLSDLGAKEIF